MLAWDIVAFEIGMNPISLTYYDELCDNLFTLLSRVYWPLDQCDNKQDSFGVGGEYYDVKLVLSVIADKTHLYLANNGNCHQHW